MSDLFAIDRWIVDTLKADSTLTALIGGASARIYADVAPQGTPFPYIVFQSQAATDLVVVGAQRVWTNSLYLCRGIAETGSWGGNLDTIAERIDLALHRGSGSNVEGVIYSCVRENPFRLVEITEGRVYRHSGGMFRILCKAA